MDLRLDFELSKTYKSKSQIARVVTEAWVEKNLFCPRCGNKHILRFANNRPVADFYCPKCNNEYELKSKKRSFGNKVPAGSYDKMISRITGNNNPDFLFMSYSAEQKCIIDLLFVPKHFFVPDIIEKRKPLSSSARRAGWVGCNIMMKEIPQQGKIQIVKNKNTIDEEKIISDTKTAYILKTDNIYNRSWLIDIVGCINKISNDEFLLSDIYSFEHILSEKHPDNNNIRPKIRQQLQILRDKNVIEFIGRGVYRKVLN